MTDTCLNCTLPICDETAPDCAFVQIRRIERSRLPEMQQIYNSRSYAKHAEKRTAEKRAAYRANPEPIKAAQERWNSRNGETRREYWRKRYHERKETI